MQILVKTDWAGLMASWMGKTDQNHIICSLSSHSPGHFTDQYILKSPLR